MKLNRVLAMFFFILLPLVMSAQDNTHLMVLNNLGKTISNLDLNTGIMNQEWLVVDHSTENTSPNDMIQYNNNLYVISSLSPTLRQFNLTTGDSIAQFTFDAYSNPYSMVRLNDKLYITLSGTDEVVVMDANNISAGPIASISVKGWPQGMLLIGEKLFVVSTGSWGSADGFVFQISTQTNAKVDSFKTTRLNPTMAIEYPIGKISVCCAGKWDPDPANILSSVEIFDAQTLNKEDSLVFQGYLDGIEKTPNDNIIVAKWGTFSVYDAANNWQPIVENRAGGKGFYFDAAGNLYTAKFDADSLYQYSSNFTFLQRWLVGDGPQNILPVNMNALNISENERISVKTFELLQNYPNPFNPTTKISFYLHKSGHVNLSIYNNMGQLIRTLINKNYNSGTQEVSWDGRSNNGVQVPSGIYYYRLTVGNNQQTRKMMLIR